MNNQLYTILRSKCPTDARNVHYLNKYVSFIGRCLQKNQHTDAIYTEDHHICPRSMWPEYSNFRDNEWNRATLTARQHYIAHWMLARAFGRGMWLAFLAMHKSSPGQGRTYLNSRLYESRRNEVRQGLTGDQHHRYGTKQSEETKAKISASHKGKKCPWNKEKNGKREQIEKGAAKRRGRKHSTDTIQKMSNAKKGKQNPNYGNPTSEETKRKIAASKVNVPRSEDAKKKMSEGHKRRKQHAPSLTCPHCGKQSQSTNNMNRWHFDNCKHKSS